MDDKTYSDLAKRTEADQRVILDRLRFLGPAAMRLDNAARGLAGDAGEVSSCVMKFIEYGKPFDAVNLEEEVGDVLWRLDQVCRAASEIAGKEITLATAKEANIRKLVARYGDKYTDQKALNRDKDAERAALTATEDKLEKLRGANPDAILTHFNPRPEDPDTQ